VIDPSHQRAGRCRVERPDAEWALMHRGERGLTVVVVVRVRVGGVGRSGLDLRSEGFHLARGSVSAWSQS
jgi:hypothetical protein